MPPRHHHSRLISLLVLVCVTTLVAEAALQALARSVTAFERVIFPDIPMILPDPQLVRRGNPRFFDHDARGFRNPSVMTRADIVAIGDSQTYGVSVEAAEAWPQVLARLSGCVVYNMGVSTYGPLHYTEMARDAASFKPHLLVVGIYFGNDLLESWQRYLRDPSRYPIPDAILRPAMQLENETPLRRRVIDFYTRGAERNDAADIPWLSSPRRFLSENSALWGFFRAVKLRLVGSPASILDRSFASAVGALTQEQLA